MGLSARYQHPQGQLPKVGIGVLDGCLYGKMFVQEFTD
jgi:hypothetical protein